MNTAFSLNGETALITGGGTGLGFGIASCFVRSGAQVVLVGRREEILAGAAGSLGESAFHLAYDINRLEDVGKFVKAAEKMSRSKISILVNNAGIHLKKAAEDTTAADFEAVLRTHVVAAQNLVQAVLPGMFQRKHGSILFIASMAALIGLPMVTAYSAAKSACVGMTRSLASEVSARGVRVNAIAPGWIESPMLRKALASDHERTSRILQRTALGCFGDPEDVGWAATYLCSPAAKFVTGVVLPVDGGASIGF